jgi:hypothetical protein
MHGKGISLRDTFIGRHFTPDINIICSTSRQRWVFINFPSWTGLEERKKYTEMYDEAFSGVEEIDFLRSIKAINYTDVKLLELFVMK